MPVLSRNLLVGEHTAKTEAQAKVERREAINAGLSVSLIAGDFRNGAYVYVWDVCA